MRNRELEGFEDAGTEEENVEVEAPGGVFRRALATVEGLDGPNDAQELDRLTLEPHFGDRVHVPILGRAADGLRPIKTGRANHGDAAFGKLRERALHMEERISFVRAEAQEGARHSPGIITKAGNPQDFGAVLTSLAS
jgi:hypothetical protein